MTNHKSRVEIPYINKGDDIKIRYNDRRTLNPNHALWISRSFDDSPLKDDDKWKWILFWHDFYEFYEKNTKNSEEQDNSNVEVQDNTKSYKRSDTHSVKYKEEVFNILDKGKDSFPLSDEELRIMQLEIESITMFFDEKSMFKTTPNIMKMLIKKDELSAKKKKVLCQYR